MVIWEKEGLLAHQLSIEKHPIKLKGITKPALVPGNSSARKASEVRSREAVMWLSAALF
jgi:hypothetical protein